MKLCSICCVAVLSLAVAAGCGSSSTRAVPVPDVTLQPLNAAEDTLDAKGLGYQAVGGGLFGTVVRSHWMVCRQSPRPGLPARSVTLYVARSCAAPPYPVPDRDDD